MQFTAEAQVLTPEPELIRPRHKPPARKILLARNLNRVVPTYCL